MTELKAVVKPVDLRNRHGSAQGWVVRDKEDAPCITFKEVLMKSVAGIGVAELRLIFAVIRSMIGQ